MKNTKAKRILAMLLALALTLTAASTLVLAAADTETPFVSIVTDSGKAVTTTYKGMIPAKTEYAEYDEGPYYHVTVPEGDDERQGNLS